MHIYVLFIMLATICCTALNAAAKDESKEEPFFALYDPSCSSCSKSTISMRGGIDEKNNQLTLTLTKDDQPISDTVRLWGNELYVQPIDGELLRRFLWNGEYIKLSLATQLQYKEVIPSKLDPTRNVHLRVESPAFTSVYIFGKFIIVDEALHCHRRLLKPTESSSVTAVHCHRPESSSVTAVIELLKSAHMSDPGKFTQPLIIIDTNQWLIKCFGTDWTHKLPVYRHPTTKEIMTQAEYDAKHPKAMTVKKPC